jgi:hypothetical protein
MVGFEHIGEGARGELATLVAVLKISGAPYLVIASLRASIQKSVLMVLDSRHAMARRVARSRIATR